MCACTESDVRESATRLHSKRLIRFTLARARAFIKANNSFCYRQLQQRYVRNVVPAPRSLPGFLLDWTPCIFTASHTELIWSQSQTYFTTDCLPPNVSSWRQAPWDSRADTIFQLSPCGHCPYVTPSLMRRLICRLWICLAFRQDSTEQLCSFFITYLHGPHRKKPFILVC
jgi:hypothetical protein